MSDNQNEPRSDIIDWGPLIKALEGVKDQIEEIAKDLAGGHFHKAATEVAALALTAPWKSLSALAKGLGFGTIGVVGAGDMSLAVGVKAVLGITMSTENPTEFFFYRNYGVSVGIQEGVELGIGLYLHTEKAENDWAIEIFGGASVDIGAGASVEAFTTASTGSGALVLIDTGEELKISAGASLARWSSIKPNQPAPPQSGPEILPVFIGVSRVGVLETSIVDTEKAPTPIQVSPNSIGDISNMVATFDSSTVYVALAAPGDAPGIGGVVPVDVMSRTAQAPVIDAYRAYDVAMASDGDTLLAACTRNDGSSVLERYDVARKQRLNGIPMPIPAGILAASRDAPVALIASYRQSTVWRLNTETGEFERSYESAHKIRNISITPGGDWAILCLEAQYVAILNINEMYSRASCTANGFGIDCVISSDASRGYISSNTGNITPIDFDNWDQPKIGQPIKFDLAPNYIALSPNDGLLYLSMPNKTVVPYDLDEKKIGAPIVASARTSRVVFPW